MENTYLFATLKGGVGKTSLATLLIRWLAVQGKKVLAIDIDVQGSLSKHFLTNSESGKSIVNAILQDDAQSNIEVTNDRIHLIPSSYKSDLIRGIGYSEIKRLIEPVESQYDYTIFDSGRGIENPVISAASASAKILTPIGPSLDSIEATEHFLSVLRRTIDGSMPEVNIILNRFPQDNSQFERSYIARAMDTFANYQVMQSTIPESRNMKRAIDSGDTMRDIKRMKKIYEKINLLFEQITGIKTADSLPF